MIGRSMQFRDSRRNRYASREGRFFNVRITSCLNDRSNINLFLKLSASIEMYVSLGTY